MLLRGVASKFALQLLSPIPEYYRYLVCPVKGSKGNRVLFYGASKLKTNMFQRSSKELGVN
jgi:hypothetical protein